MSKVNYCRTCGIKEMHLCYEPDGLFFSSLKVVVWEEDKSGHQ